MMSLMISRIEVSSPPGVSRVIRTSGTPSSAASSSALLIHFSVAGSTVPLNSIEGTVVDEVCPAAAGPISKPVAKISQTKICRRRDIA